MHSLRRRSVKAAQTVGYSFILVGFVFQAILCSAYGGLIDLLLQPDVVFWVGVPPAAVARRRPARDLRCALIAIRWSSCACCSSCIPHST